MTHLIDPWKIADEISTGRVVRLLDVRWRLDTPEGRPAYLAGHLPGAVYVDLESELARRGHPEGGRYPLPSFDELQKSARRWGIDGGDLVVAYDDNDSVSAARAWWLLRRRGVDIRVLDGGIRSWVGAGFPLETGDVAADEGRIVLRHVDPGVASIEDAARAPIHGHLIDVRAPEHYRGLARGLDPASGHIPGAVNIPTVAHISRDGTFKAPEAIRRTLEVFGVDVDREITLYCGAGIASTHSALALAHAGVEARIYAGSWSQWSRSAGRPVAVGRTPADAMQGW